LTKKIYVLIVINKFRSLVIKKLENKAEKKGRLLAGKRKTSKEKSVERLVSFLGAFPQKIELRQQKERRNWRE